MEKRANVTYDTYILGPGDGLKIELLDLPELSGTFSIGPDGTLYLPRLRLFVEGLTIEELRNFLTMQFSSYVRDPQICKASNLPANSGLCGRRSKIPGYYTLSGNTNLSRLSTSAESRQMQAGASIDSMRSGLGQLPGGANRMPNGSNLSTFGAVFPTVFDAVRSAQGITPYSDLSKVQVIRKRAEGLGGGRIKTSLNFLSLITDGDESQNIRLFDGDVINVAKSSTVLKKQLQQAGQSNLTPQFLTVYVNGRVEQAGAISMSQGSSLLQAIDLAGGPKVLHGKVEFIRFTREGERQARLRIKERCTCRRLSQSVADFRRCDSCSRNRFNQVSRVIQELTAPAVGLYSAYSIYNSFSN